LACLLTATVLSFLLTGVVGWVTTVLQAYARGEWRPGRLLLAFPMSGVYGVLFAAMGLMFTLPLVGLWRLVYPRSFDRLTRPTGNRPHPTNRP
jgi:hypothetical protein